MILVERLLRIPHARASIPIPEKLAKAIEDELKESSGTIADTDMGTYDLFPRPIGTHETLRTQKAIHSPLVPIRTQDTHDRTLRATRVRKVLDTASASVAAVAVPENTKNAANTVAICK